MKEFAQRFWKLVGAAGRIGISGHVRPDGDCIGAVTALSLYIRKIFPNKAVDVFAEFVPECFSFLKDAHRIITEASDVRKEEADPYDLFISLDCGDAERLGAAAAHFGRAAVRVNIDHHISNVRFAEENLVQEEKSSTCEVLCSLFEEDRIDREIAEALYLGILHDTGVFRHSNTSRKTMELAGMLMEKGVPFSRIIDETFSRKTYKQNLLLGSCLVRSRLHLGGRVVSAVISRREMEEAQADSSDLEGIVDQLRITRGALAAVFLHELEKERIPACYLEAAKTQPVYKVSMRVNERLDVARIAVSFGGGGHKMAAGCTIAGQAEEVLQRILAEMERQL